MSNSHNDKRKVDWDEEEKKPKKSPKVKKPQEDYIDDEDLDEETLRFVKKLKK